MKKYCFFIKHFTKKHVYTKKHVFYKRKEYNNNLNNI